MNTQESVSTGKCCNYGVCSCVFKAQLYGGGFVDRRALPVLSVLIVYHLHNEEQSLCVSQDLGWICFWYLTLTLVDFHIFPLCSCKCFTLCTQEMTILYSPKGEFNIIETIPNVILVLNICRHAYNCSITGINPHFRTEWYALCCVWLQSLHSIIYILQNIWLVHALQHDTQCFSNMMPDTLPFKNETATGVKMNKYQAVPRMCREKQTDLFSTLLISV